MVEQWRYRMPTRIRESHLRGLHDHLSTNHESVEIVALHLSGLRTGVNIDEMVTGLTWIGVSAIAFRCSGPDLRLTIEDNPSKTVEMSWSPEAAESAQFVRHLAHKCSAPLQLLCRPGWAIALPFVVWWLLWRFDPLSIRSASAWPAAAPPRAPTSEERRSTPAAVPWVPLIVGALSGLVLAHIVPRLTWVRRSLGALADWYHSLYPAVYFDLPWTTQSGNEARWVGMCCYLSCVGWLFSTLLPR